ncbi:MAG: alanine racemase [Mycoplasma sp.]|nr:alanine racemase [Candidatus Hennigella equi]
MIYRKTYAEINTANIIENIKRFKKSHQEYKYFIGVVKANCYGHGLCNETIKAMIAGGVNYFGVATLEEALEVRQIDKKVPILVLSKIELDAVKVACANKITLTIPNLAYTKQLLRLKNLKGLKVHLKIDTGMNRIGAKTSAEADEIVRLINNSNIILEGIFTHIFDVADKERTYKQYAKFEQITKNIDLKKIKMVHCGAGDATLLYKKRPYANGCRFGDIMYGIQEIPDNKYLDTYKLISKVIQVNKVKKGQTVGYGGLFSSKKDELIALVPIGFADGLRRDSRGMFVYINNKKYTIVGNVCMDMMFVKVDKNVKENDIVYIYKDRQHFYDWANFFKTAPDWMICNISKRVPRIYVKK